MKYFDGIHKQFKQIHQVAVSPQTKKIRKKLHKPFIVFLIFCILLMIFPFPQNLNKIVPPANRAYAQYQYTASAGQINGSKGTNAQNDYYSTRSADTSAWMISPVAPAGTHSLDAQVTISSLDLRNANKIIVSFRTNVSSTSLHEVFSIYDNQAGIWRPLNNHTLFNPLDPTNISNFYSAEITPAAALTFYSYQFEIFNGYFVDTTSSPGTSISTPLANFVDGSNNLLLRISSQNDPGVNTWYLNWDYAQAEVAVDPGYAASTATITTGTPTRYYSDTYTMDRYEGQTATTTTSFNNASSGNSVDEYFTFSNITVPYTSANTVLVYCTAATSVINISGLLNLYMWNYGTGAWETTALNSTNASSTVLNANRQLMFAVPLTNHVSVGGEAKLRLLGSHSTSFNLYVDWLKLIVGSTNNNSSYQNNISVGYSGTGSATSTSNVDSTSAAPDTWVITSSNDYTTQYNGDTNSTYSLAMDMSVPMSKPPSGSLITGMQFATRMTPSSTTPQFSHALRDYSTGWTNYMTGWHPSSGTYQLPMDNTYFTTDAGDSYAYPVVGAYGTYNSAILGSNPEDMLDTTNNLAGYKIRTTTGNSSSFTVAFDFVFLSSRYIQQEEEFRTQFVPDFATKNVGGAETNSWRFGQVNDSTYWTVANTGAAPGVDVTLEFRGVALPTTYNRLILYAKYSWSTASATHAILIYDYTNNLWRNVSPHAANPTDYLLLASATAATQQYYQFDIFNGYFRDSAVATPGTALDTPLSNFIGTGANAGKVQMRIVQGGTAGNLAFDWAQLEIAQDTSYYPTAMTNNVGSGFGRYYNDLYTPDNTAGSATLSNNYSSSVTKATSGTDRLDTRFDIANVSTPYVGANAILVDFQNSVSVVADTSALLQIWNCNTSSWETLNGGSIYSATATRYYRWQFIKAVTNWSDYIDSGSSNKVRLRYYSTGITAATHYFDYLKITLGSVTTPGDSSNIDFGVNFLNTKDQTANLDSTQPPTLDTYTNSAWYVLTQPQVGTFKAMDAPISMAINIDMPVTKPSGSNVTGIKWATKFAPNNTFRAGAELRDIAGNYTTITASALNAQYTAWSGASATGTGQGVAPAAADVSEFNSTTSVGYLSGNYLTNHHSILDTLNNKINFAIRTRVNILPESIVVIDMAFVSIRYIIP
jgi:hypothetical protein